jgi:hypothetical protein
MRSSTISAVATALLVAIACSPIAEADVLTVAYETTVPGYYLSSGRGITHDDAGNAYVIGRYVGEQQQSHAIIIKLDPAGEEEWIRVIDGADHDYAEDLVLDPAGDLLITGWTDSPDFPTTQGPLGTVNFRDAFIMKLDASDGAIIFSTKLGGDYTDQGHGIAVNGAGEICLLGRTGSTDFPTTPDAYQGEPSAPLYIYTDVFVTRLNAQADSIIYSSYFGGFEDEYASGFDLAPDGGYVFGGRTTSDDLPLVNPILASPNGIFVSKLSADGSTLEFSTYYGGEDVDRATGLAAGPDGAIYITGTTRSLLLPTTPGAYQPDFVGEVDGCEEGFPGVTVNCEDAFVAKMTTDGTLVYGTYLAGTDRDDGVDIAVDDLGAAYVIGYSASSDFPGSSGCCAFMFVSKLSPAGDDLVFSHAVMSGSYNAGHGISIDGPASIYFTGAVNVPADVYVSKLTDENPATVDDWGLAGGRRLSNSPNPFNPSTRIAFELPAPARVSMTIHNAAGRLVRTLIDDEERDRGTHVITWDGRDEDGAAVASGVYFCRVDAEGLRLTRRMVLLK